MRLVKDPVKTIRHCARLFLFWFALERDIDCFFVHRCCHRGNCSLTTSGMESSIPVSELPAENFAAVVVNVYGSFIGDDEDHVDDSSAEICTIPRWQISCLRFGFRNADGTSFVR